MVMMHIGWRFSLAPLAAHRMLAMTEVQMAVTADSMIAWCRRLLGDEKAEEQLELLDYLHAIPRLESLGDVPRGTAVLVRGDVDAKPGERIGEGDVRLRSMLETLRFGHQRGWKQIIFGHIGRKPEASLRKVHTRLEALLKTKITFIEDWLDETTVTVLDEVAEQIHKAQPGSFFLLENARRYQIERTLWKIQADDLTRRAESLSRLANQFAGKLARVYVHEAISAGSLDSSSTVVPAAMDRVAMGIYEAAEFEGPLLRCLEAQLVVFSGLKIDKLSDLEAIIDRGHVRRVFAAGSLAMALKKAARQLEGGDFCIGLAQASDHADQPYFIPQERIEQAKHMIEQGRYRGIEFVLPVDFVLQDTRVAEEIGAGDQQFDVGPRTSELFEQKLGEFILQARAASDREATGGVVFHNGVFGKFEDRRFEVGTKRFILQLKRLTEAGVEVYVGGGEGGAALARYGQPDWVTHCFTAGGTVLNALAGEPIPYLVALAMAAAGSRQTD